MYTSTNQQEHPQSPSDEWMLHPSSWDLCNSRALHKRVTFTQGESTAEPHEALAAQSPLNCCCWKSLLLLFKNAVINSVYQWGFRAQNSVLQQHIYELVNLNTFWLAHLYQYTDFNIDYAFTSLHMIFIWLCNKNFIESWV